MMSFELTREEVLALYRHLDRQDQLDDELFGVFIKLQKQVFERLSIVEIQNLRK